MKIKRMHKLSWFHVQKKKTYEQLNTNKIAG